MRILSPYISKLSNSIIYLLFALMCFNAVELRAQDMQTVNYIELTPTKAKHIINTYQNLIILDVRDLKQFNEKHLLGAISIPLSELNNSIQKLDKKFSILVYSLDNNETAKACKILRKNGFISLFSLNVEIDDLMKSGLILSDNISKKRKGRQKFKSNILSKSTNSYKSANYCASDGGDTSYEYIQGVTTSIISEGVLAITVEIFIANPSNCTSGNPCPEYDDSPEYINAWIDWNGNNIFDSNEKVINAALTGYSGINFSGTMSTSTVVNIPGDAVGLTWIRVNLGWGDDPNDPCQLSWGYGNVLDKEVIILNNPPEIEDITIIGTGEGVNPIYPLTKGLPLIGKEKIRFEAKIKENDNYEITEINWGFDKKGIKVGKGNPYESPASPGTHGKRRVTCNLIYKHKLSGTINKHTLSKDFKVFFEKDGSDNLLTPNWFRYWKKDGAVPNFDDNIKYDKTYAGYGVFSSSTGKIKLGKIASGQHYTNSIIINKLSFGGPTVTGIDCAAEVISHENYHKWVINQWETGGTFENKTDSDKNLDLGNDDKLPDYYEQTVSKTDISNTDTYSLATKKSPVYSKYGDQEYMAMVKGNSKRGIPSKDWSFPGKQTVSTAKSGKNSSKSKASETVSYAQFTNTYTDEGVDNNSNGIFDFLRVTAELDVSSSGNFFISAKLNVQGSVLISFVSEQINLSEGMHVWTADFDGIEISEGGIDGPYTVTFELFNGFGDHQIDYKENAYTTSNYSVNDFKIKDVHFTDKYTDQGLDLNNDSKYDSLNINVEVIVNKDGTYKIEGGLYDENGSIIETVTTTLSLSKGTQDVTLAFDGKKISAGRLDGPYYLKYLGIGKEDTLIDFRLDAYTTSLYSYLIFQSSFALFDNQFNFEGIDTDDDVKFNYLRTIIGINAEIEGQFKVLGSIFDSQDNFIVEKEILVDLSIGVNTVNLDFDGKAINAFGIDGPYVLKSLLLIDLNGITVDYLPVANTTQEFLYSEFQQPDARLVTLTGSYEGFKTDVNSTCTYDFLTIKAEVDLSVSGYIVTRAKLEDSDKNEIVWAENIELINIDNGTTQHVTLNFDGLSIEEHGVNGPYYVKNFYVYHTGDPTIPDFNKDAYTTQPYRYVEYDSIPGLEKPIIHRTENILACNISSSYYEWFLDDILISGANQQTYVVDKIGNYQVKVSDEFGCTSSLSDNLYVDSTLSSPSDLEFAKDIVVYPNPTDGILNLKGVDILEETFIQLFDVWGKLLFNKEIISRDTEIDITKYASGMYFIIITQENKRATYKVVKQ